MTLTTDEDGVFGCPFPPDENLIGTWQEYGCLTQDAYPEYHQASIITLLGHLIDAEMHPQYGTVHNNMWCIILGSSGVSGKSTACGAAVSLLYDDRIASFGNRITNKFTPEALTLALHEHPEAFQYSDECVGFLKYLKRDFATELTEDFIAAYDGRQISKQTVRGRNGDGEPIIVSHPKLSAIWNTTPEAFGEYVTKDMFESGFFLRPFFIMPQRVKGIKQDAPIDDYCKDLRERFTDDLAELLKLINRRTVTFTESDYINDWKYNLRKESSVGKFSSLELSIMTRNFDQARKAAMNLTLGSTEFYNHIKKENTGGDIAADVPITYAIPDKYAEIACGWAEGVFFENAKKAFKLQNGGMYWRVMKLLESGRKMSLTEIGDAVRMSGRQLRDLLVDLPVTQTYETVANVKRPVTYYQRIK